ncbi:hypothetical protein B0O99DRAFT_643913 [Bisporella sp. PMI_857]|nr:hypothetical protein B0O99DRAFT_643913 [Bisporella sp. PMI_857]
MNGLLSLGIGPFQIHTFNSETVTNQTFRRKPTAFELKVCFATQGSIVFEITQPVSGHSIMTEFFRRHDEGIHHIAFDCNRIAPAERKAEFERRGFGLVQSGI